MAIAAVAPVVEMFRTEDNSQPEIVVVVAAVEVPQVLLPALKLPLPLQPLAPARLQVTLLVSLQTLKAQSEANLSVVVVVIEGLREATLPIFQALPSAVVLIVVVAVAKVVGSYQVFPQTPRAHQVVSRVSHIVPRNFFQLHISKFLLHQSPFKYCRRDWNIWSQETELWHWRTCRRYYHKCFPDDRSRHSHLPVWRWDFLSAHYHKLRHSRGLLCSWYVDMSLNDFDRQAVDDHST